MNSEEKDKAVKRAKMIVKVNLYLTVFWAALLIPSIIWWKESILWVIILSVYANVSGHYAAYIAARSEVAGYENPD